MRAEILSSGTKGRARQSGIVLGWLGLVVVLGVFSVSRPARRFSMTRTASGCGGKRGSSPPTRPPVTSWRKATRKRATKNSRPTTANRCMSGSWIIPHNRTGRALWYLRAEFDIESEYPPCTNWTGEGPDGGPTGSEQYSDSVFWGDQSRTLSAPAGMLRGESRQGVVYLAVFHTDQPSFERWRAYVTHSEPDKAAPVRSGTTPSEPARTPGFPLGLSDPSSDQAVADVGRPAEMFGGGSESHPRPGSGCRSNRRWWR